jgi:plastocyanin
MKAKLIILSLAVAGISTAMYAETHTITNSGQTFSPDEITIGVGDVIDWDIADFHNVVEVTQETWNANGNTSNGGFSLGFGGGEVTFNTAGTFYYVCEPHASSGMKGIVHVETVTGISDVVEKSFPLLTLYPNPANDFVTLEFAVEKFSNVQIDLYDVTGRKLQGFLSSEFSSGEYSRVIDLTGFSPGKYFVYFIANEEVRVQPLFKID